MKKYINCMRGYICFILIAAMLAGMLTLTALSLTSCGPKAQTVHAASLMDGVTPSQVSGKAPDSRFISSTANFSIELFKSSLKNGENSLICPTSALIALSMTANGTDKETLSQMQQVLGGGCSIDTLNDYLYTYTKSLTDKSPLKLANSIWFRDQGNSFSPKEDFLQKNANYYNAGAYKSPFDSNTVKEINSWVSQNTDGKIDKLVDTLPEEAVMLLINAASFDAKWESPYTANDVFTDTFTTADNKMQNAAFMRSSEYTYLEDKNATGFVKPYADSRYSFAAILPNNGISLEDYIDSMSSQDFLNIIISAKNESVAATLPKFSYSCSLELKDALAQMGIKDAFTKNADLSKLGTYTGGYLCIGSVAHSTFISVDELGTKAGAATKVQIEKRSCAPGHIVNLNRPFLYAIIDNSTNLPIFTGAVRNVK